ncbi:MAG: molybdopterin converting factor subunit 1 [Sorangiineae bacterium NIC37A_2]|jgi:molybdopterin converting factor subunit 1|nr:MAG: molybdopterin converting factor subunit 1 [Sorangiineae bacterium NIC37A_2]
MKVRVLFFAGLRDELGIDDKIISLEANAPTVETVIEALDQSPSSFSERGVRAAVNEEFTTFDHALREGDTVAFIPPVSGG